VLDIQRYLFLTLKCFRKEKQAHNLFKFFRAMRFSCLVWTDFNFSSIFSVSNEYANGFYDVVHTFVQK
jgi:hypothetical protein